MKLTRLYCNQPTIFPNISFRPGLNVVLAEMRLPEIKGRDNHNLGKTTLAELIDFCLLKSKRKEFFLFKHEELFRDFVFYLEISLPPESGNGFVTIRRGVDKPSKISFLKSVAVENAASLQESQWTHWELSFEKAVLLLDGLLDLQTASPWDFRKPLGYALRLQNDYRDVFQLDKNKGKHAQWKPLLAHLLGLEGALVGKSYELAEAADVVGHEIATLEPQLIGLANDPDALEGMLLLRGQEVVELEAHLASFDFQIPDGSVNNELVSRIETEIAENNERRYHLGMRQKRIEETLGDPAKFDMGAIEKMFSEAGVYFGNQIKRDYDALVQFLTAISRERAEYLSAELADIAREMPSVLKALAELNRRRVAALEQLRAAETFDKYRRHTERLVELKTTVGILERQRQSMETLLEARRKLAAIERERQLVLEQVKDNVHRASTQSEIYRRIRLNFGRFIKAVLERDAVLSTAVNKEGNIEFRAEIVDESGTATSADMGHTYKKLLCVAFDVALFSAYLDARFVRFVYHDGIFESLDDRKKQSVLDEIRHKCDAGLQQIITVIDSDLPVDSSGRRMRFPEEEVVRLLHDEGQEGRLFRMPQW